MILLLFLAGYLLLAPSPPDDGRWDDYAWDTVVLTGKAADPGCPADGSRDRRTFTLKQICVLHGFGGSSGTKESLSETISERSEYYPYFTNEETVLCYLQEESDLPRVGSTVRVEGKVGLFSAATNPGEFDYRAYQNARGCVLSLRDVTVLEESDDFDRAGQFLFELQSRIAGFFIRMLGGEDGALACAMVLGEKGGLDESIKTLYQEAGISHLLAISGLHISMIGLGLLAFLKKMRLPAWLCGFASTAVLWAYAAMVGMSVSTKRAAFMFSLMLAAGFVGRTADTLTSLTMAAFWILIMRPALAADAGFQLSFSAVAGIAVIVPVLRERGPRPPGREKGRLAKLGESLRDSALASFGVTLSMLPFLLFHYFEWNPWSILANLVVIPLMSVLLFFLMLLAALGLCPSGCWPVRAAAQTVLLPVKGIFFLYRTICEGIVALPFGRMRTGAPGKWQLVIFGIGLFLLVRAGVKIRPSVRIAAAALLTCVFLIRIPNGLRITMLDVGQGECVCLESPDRKFWLLDAGSTSSGSVGKYQIVPFLKYSAADGLEGIFISHWDEDHVNALEDIFDWAKNMRLRIGALFLPDTALRDESLDALLRLTALYEIPVKRISAGMVLRAGNMKLTCLHPTAGQTAADRNYVSTVLRLEYGSFSALFTGDLETEGEQWLVKTYGESVLTSTLLDAGHHGAKNASGSAFLETVSPKAILITCGRNNRYGHPAPEMLERAAEAEIPCFITARSGALSVSVKKDRMTIAPFLSDGVMVK